MSNLDSWKETFLDKLHTAQEHCANQFEKAIDRVVMPVFQDLATFLRDNGFQVSTPLKEPSRRSFKFELAENAYLLVIFRFTGVGEFELLSETFAPGAEPVMEKSLQRVADVEEAWTEQQFRTGLDRFVNLLGGESTARPEPELAAV
jgi:hypothetical protein